MYENRIAHLEELHRSLDRRITAMEQSGVFDDEYMSNMKKERLRIKDEIAILNRKQWEHDHETIHGDDER
jgi:uncharacterized protein YdcH (DUF465 family)